MDSAIPVLVVEDEALILAVLEDALVEAGFTISKASRGEEAIEMLEAKNIPFRALITDVNLGSHVTGWDVARHARLITPELPVIYTTATPHDWEAMGVPNSIFIVKPYVPMQILTAVSQLLNAATPPAVT